MRTAPENILDTRGFTLLESMVALSILAFGLMAVVGLFTASIRGNTQGGRMTSAVSLAQLKMEEFKATAYPNINAPTASEITANTGIDSQGNLGGPYTRSWTVSEDTGLQLKTVTVTVKWQSLEKDNTGKPIDHVVRLVTKRAYDR